MMNRYALLSAVAAIGLLLSPLRAYAAEASPSDQVRFDQQTQDILKSLQVNGRPPGAAIATRDSVVTLSGGINEMVGISIGSEKTVQIGDKIQSATMVSPDVADIIVISSNQLQILAKKEGSTDLVIVSKNHVIYKAHIVVAVNAGPVQAALNAAIPDVPITASAVNGAIMLTGVTRDATAAATAVSIAGRFVADPSLGVINNITLLGAQQVLLRVRVAEVARTVVKQLGLNTAIGGIGGQAIVGNQVAEADNARINAANPETSFKDALTFATNPVAYFSTKAMGTVFTTVASTLESEGLVRTLSEPTLVTESGKTASMLAGSQYPVPAISESGQTGTQYQNFGVSLAFTPTVLSPNDIGLTIATEVSTKAENVTFPNASGAAFNVPVFDTRKANTTVDLPSGGSIVIAGLVSSDFQNTLSGIPGLKDIPILGKLFSSAAFQRDETELVISVTAYLVGPTDPSNLSDPTVNLEPPTDTDLYLLGRLTGASTRQLGAAPKSAVTTFGYITE